MSFRAILITKTDNGQKAELTSLEEQDLMEGDVTVDVSHSWARPWQVLFDVTLPVIAPALVSGWLLAFTISLDDVVITSFTTGPGSTTLPILIWSKVRLGVTPDINALATVIIGLVAVGVVMATLIMHRAEKRRERDVQSALSQGAAG